VRNNDEEKLRNKSEIDWAHKSEEE